LGDICFVVGLVAYESAAECKHVARS
jgi:hypothetical protein